MLRLEGAYLPFIGRVNFLKFDVLVVYLLIVLKQFAGFVFDLFALSHLVNGLFLTTLHLTNGLIQFSLRIFALILQVIYDGFEIFVILEGVMQLFAYFHQCYSQMVTLLLQGLNNLIKFATILLGQCQQNSVDVFDWLLAN